MADQNHQTVALKSVEVRALKAWIDLNCPLWPDYRFRAERPALAVKTEQILP